MSEFQIAFNPPLPAVAAMDPPMRLDDVDVSAVTTGYRIEHDVLYSIGGKVFAYYTASILTVLNDLHLEWCLIRERCTHDVTLAGYTVLEAVFEEGCFQFRSPAWPPAPVCGRFEADYLERKFRSAVAEVWGLVRSIQNADNPGQLSI